jgi:predicted CxxxxCH...CXXCH cytochrome family protein
MPDTPSHRLHRAPSVSEAIDCSECHSVPETVASEGHLDRGERTPADVTFGPLARARGQSPRYQDGTCHEVACHGAGLPDGLERSLRWDERASGGCGGCHGAPPAEPHPQQASCAASVCHGDVVRAGTPLPAITELGRARHVDGTVDHGSR